MGTTCANMGQEYKAAKSVTPTVIVLETPICHWLSWTSPHATEIAMMNESVISLDVDYHPTTHMYRQAD